MGVEWNGKPRSEAEWKVLLISAHAYATGLEFEISIGLEGELIEVRESSAKMSKARSSSLIEYAIAFLECARCDLYDLPN